MEFLPSLGVLVVLPTLTERHIRPQQKWTFQFPSQHYSHLVRWLSSGKFEDIFAMMPILRCLWERLSPPSITHSGRCASQSHCNLHSFSIPHECYQVPRCEAPRYGSFWMFLSLSKVCGGRSRHVRWQQSMKSRKREPPLVPTVQDLAYAGSSGFTGVYLWILGLRAITFTSADALVSMAPISQASWMPLERIDLSFAQKDVD